MNGFHRWRTISVDDGTFAADQVYLLVPLGKVNPLQRRPSSIHEQVQSASRFLEYQRQRLQFMKREVERKVNQQLGRSDDSLHLRRDNDEENKRAAALYEQRRDLDFLDERLRYRLRQQQQQQVSKSQPALFSYLPPSANPEGEAEAKRAHIAPEKPARPVLLPVTTGRRSLMDRLAAVMSSPSTSSTSSVSTSAAAMQHENGAVRTVLAGNVNGTYNQHNFKQNGDVAANGDLNGSPSIYANARRRFHRSPYLSRSDNYAASVSPPTQRSEQGKSQKQEAIDSGRGDDEEEEIVFNANGEIVSGTLPALLKRLMPSKNYVPDNPYIFSFLLNARLFISPLDLLQEIVQHCIFEQNAKTENFKKELRTKFFHNVLQLMSEWTETFAYDFRHDKMKERLKLLLELCCSSSDPTLRNYKNVLMQNVANKVSKLDRYEKALGELQRDGDTAVCSTENLAGIVEKCSNPVTVAQQLTHIELERLSMIGPEEFVHAFAKECSSKDTASFLINQSAKGTKTGSNIEHYVEWCNRLSRLVATEICMHIKKKRRARVIEFFIDVAKECFNMGNFNSLMSIVGGMDVNAVARLKKTWSKVDVSKLAILEHQLDPSGNFLSYRSTLKAAVWRSAGATKDTERIVVPFFSLLWKDLLVSYEGCSKLLPNGHLNFAMFSQFATQMKEFLQWKQVECPFEKNDALLRYILTSPTYNDRAMQLASFEYEPPEQAAEKELYKKLKMASSSNGTT